MLRRSLVREGGKGSGVGVGLLFTKWELLIMKGETQTCLFRYVIEKGHQPRDRELVENHQAIITETNSCLSKWGGNIQSQESDKMGRFQCALVDKHNFMKRPFG